MTISSKLKSLLKMHNVEHSELANYFGISRQSLTNKFFRGSFSATDLIKIATFLKCDLCFLTDESKISLNINDIEDVDNDKD